MSDDDEDLRNHIPIARLGVMMTMPVAGFDPSTGEPQLDFEGARNNGYGLIIDVHIHAKEPLHVARKMLVDALAQVDAGLAEEEDVPFDADAAVEDFDVDKVISHIFEAEGSSHEPPPANPKDDDGPPPTGLYL